AELKQGLVRFNDTIGRQIVTLLDGSRIDDSSEDDLFASVMSTEGTVATGYRLLQDRVFVVLGHRLTLFGETLGSLTHGFVVDDRVAARLGAVVDSDVCFSAAVRCVAVSSDAVKTELGSRMLGAMRDGTAIFATVAGRRMALVSNTLPGSLPFGAVI